MFAASKGTKTMPEEEKKPAPTVVAAYTVNHYSDGSVKFVPTIGENLTEDAIEGDVRALGLQLDQQAKEHADLNREAQLIAYVLDQKTPGIVEAVKKALKEPEEAPAGSIKKTPSSKN